MAVNIYEIDEYTKENNLGKPTRSVEYDALAKVSNKLSESWRTKKENFTSFVEALNLNLRLWRTIAIDVANEENKLSTQLRAQLFYLYQFVDQHTRSAMNDKAGVDILIEINTSMMRGLRGEGAIS